MGQNIENFKNNINKQLNIGVNQAPIYLEEQKTPKILSGTPIRPNVFIGRDNSIDAIQEALVKDGNKMVLLSGKGGIGKTTLAAQYYFKYFHNYSHLIWIVPKEGIKESIIALSDSLDLKVNHMLDRETQVETVLRFLTNLKGSILLVVDNANNIEDLDDNFKTLRQLQNIDIIITSRLENFQNVRILKVKALNNYSANELFKYYFKACKTEEQHILDKIFEAVEYNTLVIELLAKNLNEFNNELSENYPIRRLLEDIQQRGLLKISKSTILESDYILQMAKPEDIIRGMYDVSRITEDEKIILYSLAFLPSISISFDELKLLLPQIKNLDRRLLSLHTRGWLEYEKESKSFKVHPIVAEVSREKIKPLIKTSKRLFDIMFSLGALLFLFPPIFIVISLLIKTESEGPAFMKAKRIGIGGEEFFIYKFRTLKTSRIQIGNDSRVTKVGMFLRKVGLDTLPQFINVLKGEMSIVGPIPYLYLQSESSENLHKIVKEYAKPGMTSLFGISKEIKSTNSREAMLHRIRYDIIYIQNWSLFLDVKIIFKTMIELFKGDDFNTSSHA